MISGTFHNQKCSELKSNILKLIMIEVHCTVVCNIDKNKEYVASLIGLYKNNCAVLCVGIDFLLIWPLKTLQELHWFSKEVVSLGSAIGGVGLWADIVPGLKPLNLTMYQIDYRQKHRTDTKYDTHYHAYIHWSAYERVLYCTDNPK